MKELLRINMADRKLWVTGDASAEEHEMYLPDCTEEEIKVFLTKHVNHIAKLLSEERPWRKSYVEGIEGTVEAFCNSAEDW